MKAIIFESNEQVDFENMSTKINEHLKDAIERYSADNYCLWSNALTNISTEQRAFKIKADIQSQIEGALTLEEIASVVDIPLTDEEWFPIPIAE